MIAPLFASLIFAVPVRAAAHRAEAAAPVEITRVSPLAPPLSAPAAAVAPISPAAPSVSIPISAWPAPEALRARPSAAAVEGGAGSSSAAPALDVPTAASPSFANRIRGLLRPVADPFANRKALFEDPPDTSKLHPLLTGRSTGLELDGLGYRNAALTHAGVPAPVLGSGTHGVVTVHPKIPGAVLKTVLSLDSVNPVIEGAALTPAAHSEKEARTARGLEAAGLGPRYFGDAVLDGRFVSVRERVYGRTLATSILAKAYGPVEHALTLVLLAKMASARLYATDLKPSNIMIGRTAADPELRAYLIDGGALRSMPTGLPAEKGVVALLNAFVSFGEEGGFGTTLGKILQKSLPGGRTEKAAPSNAAAQRLARGFAERDFWSQVGPGVRAEIENLRGDEVSEAAARNYVRREVNAVFERVKAARGLENIAFHYNLHGGAAAEYVGEGIQAERGDVALEHAVNGDLSEKVHFFKGGAFQLYEILDARNPLLARSSTRMGDVLSVFDLDSPELRAARADGRIAGDTRISMDFRGMRGVPYSAYLAPPLEIYRNTARKIGLASLTRDEETLATARYLEAALTQGGAFVPRAGLEFPLFGPSGGAAKDYDKQIEAIASHFAGGGAPVAVTFSRGVSFTATKAFVGGQNLILDVGPYVLRLRKKKYRMFPSLNPAADNSAMIDSLGVYARGHRILQEAGVPIPALHPAPGHEKEFLLLENVDDVEFYYDDYRAPGFERARSAEAVRKADESFFDFVRTTARFRNIGDFRGAQLAYSRKKGWILLDFSDNTEDAASPDDGNVFEGNGRDAAVNKMILSSTVPLYRELVAKPGLPERVKARALAIIDEARRAKKS